MSYVFSLIAASLVLYRISVYVPPIYDTKNNK